MEFNSSRDISNERRRNILVENYKEYIEETAEKTGFIRSILEKVERLLNILE